ncbi:MAG: LysR family transcriptional regulator, partial [Myxococcales bacterium]|nr:LysR family transcriptional regulator [Myxococcales bacterium]
MRQKAARVPDYETRVGDLHDLRAFALACDLRSLTAVAAVTGESKATASRRITRLEAALGITLLRRSPRGIVPTDEGLAYRLRIRQVLELLGDANATAIHGGRATPSGQLRVSVPPGLSTAIAPLFTGFCAAYPQITMVVHLSSRFVDLEAEHFDVALRATAKLADSSLVAIRVGDPQPEGILVGAPAYVQAHPPLRR